MANMFVPYYNGDLPTATSLCESYYGTGDTCNTVISAGEQAYANWKP